MNRAYKFRLYPNKQQCKLLGKTFGCTRFIYNKMLSDKKKYYEKTGKILKNTPAQYKDEYEWLKEVDSLALANAQLDLNNAFKNFHRNDNIGYPKFKSKKKCRKSYTTNLVNGNIRLEHGFIRLPKLGMVKIKQHRSIPEGYKLKAATVSQSATGKYHASVLYEYEKDIKKVEPEIFIGLDYSMKELYVDSDGRSAEYPRYYRRSLEKLRKEQRKLSKCQKKSSNRNKQRLKVAKIHEKVSNQRTDFLHKLSRQIANAVDVVCIEDLNMKGMSKSLNFGKSVSDNSYGRFSRMLEYKLTDIGKQLVKIDKCFPSSKMCSECDNVKKELSLSERMYRCEVCGAVLDRDHNAGRNIRNEGMRMLLGRSHKDTTVGHTGIARLCCSH